MKFEMICDISACHLQAETSHIISNLYQSKPISYYLYRSMEPWKTYSKIILCSYISFIWTTLLQWWWWQLCAVHEFCGIHPCVWWDSRHAGKWLWSFLLYKSWLVSKLFILTFKLSYWPLGDLDSIFEVQFSILFYWLVSPYLLMITPSDKCRGTLLMIWQHWFR